MEPVYVTGHRNPDTDSIVASIAYASLKNALGDRDYTPVRIGDVSDQTRLVLDKFGFEAPPMLNNVRTQVRDLKYDRPPILSSAVTVHTAWESIFRGDLHDATLPVTDEEGRLYGLLTAGDVASHDMRFVEEPVVTGVPLFNLVSVLDGHMLDPNALVTEVSGEIVVALPATEGLPALNRGDIVLCGAQKDVMRHAAQAGVSCLIVCRAGVDAAEAEQLKDTLVILTPFDAYRAARLVLQAVPVSRICRTEELIWFHEDDYLDDVKPVTAKSRFRGFPVLDEDGRVVGVLSRSHLLSPNRKRVVLVDHNELSQSVSGLEQADILEIIDHHRLADVQTAGPVYVRNEPVGSTCTVITSMFMEHGVVPGKALAGLLAAAIVSDTILFKSPTSTPKDRVMAERMARTAGVSLEELGREIFALSFGGGEDLGELLMSDFKQFHIAGHSLGIGQITCFNSEEISIQRGDMLSVMDGERAKGRYDTLLLMVTDVLKEGTELWVSGDAQPVEDAFGVRVRDGAVFLPGVMSRKKQVVPAMSLMWG